MVLLPKNECNPRNTHRSHLSDLTRLRNFWEINLLARAIGPVVARMKPEHVAELRYLANRDLNQLLPWAYRQPVKAVA